MGEPLGVWTGRTSLSHPQHSDHRRLIPYLDSTLTKPEKVFIFGPEGETGERSSALMAGVGERCGEKFTSRLDGRLCRSWVRVR